MLNNPQEEKYQNSHKQIFSLLRSRHEFNHGFSVVLSLSTKTALLFGSILLFKNDTSNNELWLPISLSVIQDIMLDGMEFLSHANVEKARDQLVIDFEQHPDQDNIDPVPLFDLNNDIKIYSEFAKQYCLTAMFPISLSVILDIVLSLKNEEYPKNGWIPYTFGAYTMFRGLANAAKGMFLQEYKKDYQNRLSALSRNPQRSVNEIPNAQLQHNDVGRDLEYGSFRP